MSFIIRTLASGLGLGYSPIASGTLGAIWGIPIFIAFAGLPVLIFALTLIAFTFFSIWISNQAIPLYGNEDPSQIVIDEIVGMLFAVAFWKPEIKILLVGFILFRLFDILKPWPVNWMETRFPAGWGVVLDDVMAGIYANLTMWILFKWIL